MKRWLIKRCRELTHLVAGGEYERITAKQAVWGVVLLVTLLSLIIYAVKDVNF